MCAWVTNYFSNIQLFATHWTAVRRSPLSMEFSRQEYWGGLGAPLQGIFWPRDGTRVSYVSCTGKKFLYH